MTLQTALLQGTQLLEEAAVGVPRLTAEVLLSHALKCERVYLYAHPEQELREVEWLHYGRYLHERLQGKPTQYITKRQEFYGREFRVTPDVLIPRPETEHVVEVALAAARGARRMVDVGTGDRSEKIRTYNFPQNRVTDHRINFTLHQLDVVMDGKLDPIIEALTNYYRNQQAS